MSVVDMIERLGCGCEAFDHQKKLISIDEALAAITEAVPVVDGVEVLPLMQARGRVLAEPVLAQALAPPFDNSAMDGYAISSASLQGNGPWQLEVVGRITAGSVGTVARGAGQAAEQELAGQAVRIFTGAPIPAGADAVVMQEAVERCGTCITLTERPQAGSHIRRSGEDMRPGDLVLEAGCLLGSREIAACAAAGQGSFTVRRRIRVAFLTTGDELTPAGEALGQAQIWDVNTPMIASAIPANAFEVVSHSTAADDPVRLQAHLEELLEQSDLLITTGGVSVGEADFVKPALFGLGLDQVFSGVAIKPGKPVTCGRLAATTWLGLPGNPVSAFVTWTLFGRHLLRCLSGETPTARRRRHVVLGETARHRPGRCELRPASLTGFDGMGREIACFGATTHSARLSSLAKADGAIFIPGDTEEIAAGGLAEFLPFPDC